MRQGVRLFSLQVRCYARRVRRSIVLALALIPTLALAQGDPSAAPEAPPSAAAVLAPAATPPVDATPAGFDHQAMLDDVRARSEQLQSRILTAREKVMTLRAEIIRDNLTPTRILLSHKNDMGPSFKLEAIEYELDGVVLVSRPDPLLDATSQLEVLNGDVRPGDHELRVTLTFLGTGTGPYASVGGYRFKVPSTFKLVTPNGRLTEATVIASVRPDADLDPRQRFSVRLDATSIPLVPRPTPAAR